MGNAGFADRFFTPIVMSKEGLFSERIKHFSQTFYKPTVYSGSPNQKMSVF